MYNYHCENCKNIIGKWDNEHKLYIVENYCNYISSKKNYPIYFLDCKKCNKFIGIICYNVCGNCFSEKEIIGEENLLNFMSKYKIIVPEFMSCKNCKNKKIFKMKYWFFEELTFYKQ